MLKVLVGGLVTGIVVFVWGSISHLATPIGEMGVRQIPGEDKVVPAMKGAIHEPGFYFWLLFIPGKDGFPTDFTTGAALDEVIGWFLGAVVLAAIVRPAKPKSAAPR